MRWLFPVSASPSRPVDVDEALDTTDEVCCRRSDSSRLRRLTYVMVRWISLTMTKQSHSPLPPAPSLAQDEAQQLSRVLDGGEGLRGHQFDITSIIHRTHQAQHQPQRPGLRQTSLLLHAHWQWSEWHSSCPENSLR